MSPLPVTAAPVALTAECLKTLLEDMGAQPGWHESGQLYRWYVGLCEQDGLPPVSAKAFGTSLKRLGYAPARRRFGGQIARCWFLTRRALRGLPPSDTALSTGQKS
jgi:hypothetical protein